MKLLWALQIVLLLILSATSMAATVKYQSPNLTIVARHEQLGAVLKSLGEEMRIYVTIPAGLKPVVDCDIQQQPVKQALKALLGDLSYQLQWEEKSGRLLGLTILAGQSGSAIAINEARVEAERAQSETLRVEEQAAQEEKSQEDITRHDAEMATYFNSVGLELRR